MMLLPRQLRLLLLHMLALLRKGIVTNSLSISVLYESPRLLIINKPSGVQHHDEIVIHQPNDGETVDDDDSGIVNVDLAGKSGAEIVPGIVTAVRESLVQRSDGGQQYQQEQQRLWGVHRLDRVTTGILVFAKDQEMASRLSHAFREGEIQKFYVGVSGLKPKKKKQGWVKGGMERSRNKTWKLINTKTAHRHPNYAKTRFFTSRVELFQENEARNTSVRPEEDDDGEEGQIQISNNNTNNVSATVILFKPITGKTHQLRVAAKAMGIPLTGDPIYKSSSSSSSSPSSSVEKDLVSTATRTIGLESLLVQKRTLLHASGIHIPKLVDDQDEVNLWCPPPFFKSDTGSSGGHDSGDDDLNESFSSSSIDNDRIFQSSVHMLMEKHCDVSEILQAMRSHSSFSINCR